MSMTGSVDTDEIARFSRVADQWWDVDGPFRPLHRLNPARLSFIRAQAEQHFAARIVSHPMALFAGLTALDLGCGGGLVSEPLARMGFAVTGIDADDRAVAIARDHAATTGLNIDYQVTTAEALCANGHKADLVLALEIIEHVTDMEAFLTSVTNLVAPGGLVILSTLNRTKRGFLLGIVAAEYVLRWVPRGTHQWHKFVRPSELAMGLRRCGFAPIDLRGVVYDPLRQRFNLSADDMAVNYIMAAAYKNAAPD